MSAFKFIRDAATGEHTRCDGGSFLPFPLSLASNAIGIISTIVGMPLALAWSVLRLPDRCTREWWLRRQQRRRDALTREYIRGYRDGKGEPEDVPLVVQDEEVPQTQVKHEEHDDDELTTEDIAFLKTLDPEVLRQMHADANDFDWPRYNAARAALHAAIKAHEALPPERRGDQTTAEARAYYAARAALNAIPGRHVF